MAIILDRRKRFLHRLDQRLVSGTDITQSLLDKTSIILYTPTHSSNMARAKVQTQIAKDDTILIELLDGYKSIKKEYEPGTKLRVDLCDISLDPFDWIPHSGDIEELYLDV